MKRRKGQKSRETVKTLGKGFPRTLELILWIQRVKDGTLYPTQSVSIRVTGYNRENAFVRTSSVMDPAVWKMLSNREWFTIQGVAATSFKQLDVRSISRSRKPTRFSSRMRHKSYYFQKHFSVDIPLFITEILAKL